MSDVLLIVGVVAAMGAVAALMALTLGRRVARRSRMGAVLLCGMSPSAALLLVEGGVFAAEANGRGDGPAMALAGSMIFAVLALPVTLAIAAIVLWRRRAG